MIALRSALVKMFFTLQVHEVEFIDQTMPLKQLKGAIYRYAVNSRIDLASPAKKLAGVEMLLCRLDNAQNRTALVGHAQSARHKLRLQSAGLFSFREGHIRHSVATSLARHGSAVRAPCLFPSVVALHLFFYAMRQLLNLFSSLEHIEREDVLVTLIHVLLKFGREL